ncbi:MAG: STAS domain-containing protein [Phycisphaerales bacterium]|nr:MAG: STAS domain-containing protein [Phycisphaerales bacterium]
MGMQYLSHHALLFTLPREPHLGNELEIAIRMTSPNATRDIIVDFSLVEIMASGTLSELMILERQLSDSDRRLVLCSVPRRIRSLFTQVGLGGLFQFAEDQLAALQSFEPSRSAYK